MVCDRGNERSRMQIFTKNGHFIKKIAIRYIDIVAGLAVTSQGHIVAVDSVSPTVFVINDTGNLLNWFDCSDYMREPSDIAISGTFYIIMKTQYSWSNSHLTFALFCVYQVFSRKIVDPFYNKKHILPRIFYSSLCC